MRREDFKAVLVWWKRLKLPEMVSRELALPASPTQVISVVGVRRCGKTYLLFNTMKQLLRELEKDNIIYVNFEHERLRNLDADDLGELLVAQREIFEPDEAKPTYMFLDEIQNVRDWDKWVRRIHDERRFRIFVTGSSSKLLSREIATSLRGRCLSFVLYPFSFAEFLEAKNYSFESLADIQYSGEKGKVLKFLREYMKFGGFPEVVLEGDEETKNRLLSSYFETIFYKDIVERYGVKNLALLDDFLRYAINNFSSYLSLTKVEKYFKSTGIKCSKKTLANFLKYSEMVFLLSSLEIFSHKIKDRMQYPRKIYCADTGIVNRFAPKFSENLGKLAENVVYLELRRKFEPPEHEIFYWRNRQWGEVDFVVKEGLRVKHLVQVCWDPTDEETKKREMRGLAKAMEEFKLKKGLVLTSDFEGEEKVEERRILYRPLWKWLLEG
ncbi:MAG: ATP-binding protein [Candidatus Hadarchaeaceae archaeon]